MSINTNFNVNPYFDDYDAGKKFLRLLFKPGYAVQARELTQVQTLLQNQIQRQGDFVFKNGSLVSGGGIVNATATYLNLSPIYVATNVNNNKITLEEAYNFMCQEFNLLEKRNYRKEYDNYHAKPEQRKNRSKRVLARRKMEKKGRVHKGDGKDVDHKNGNPKDNSDDNLRVLSKSKNRSMNEDHGAGFEGTPELVNKLLKATPGSNAPFVGMKSIPYLESRLDKKLKAKKK